MTIQEAIDQYLEHLRASRSLNTARTYAVGLRRFTHYLETQGLALTEPAAALTRAHAIGFVAWLYEALLKTAGGRPEKVPESTKNTYYAAVSGLFEYLVVQVEALPLSMADYDALRKTLSRAARPIRRENLPPDKLPAEEIVAALAAAVRQPPDLPADLPPGERRRRRLAWLRDIAIIEALRSSGMRVGESVRLERGDLLHETRGALVRYAKGNKEREVLFSQSAWEAILAYLAERADGAGGLRLLASLPLFARHDRAAGARVLPLTTRRVQQIFNDLAISSGIIERFHLTPHTLRHFFATEFLSRTGDLALTQYALGHTSPITTRIYAQTRRSDYRAAYHNAFDPPEPEEK